MRKQRNYPFIYGFKSTYKDTVRDLKDVIQPTKEFVLEQVLRTEFTFYSYSNLGVKADLNYYTNILELDERQDKLNLIIITLFQMLEGWYATIPLRDTLEDRRIKAYLAGIPDGKRKLINAVKKYKGQYTEYKKDLISAINQEAFDRSNINVSRKLEIYRETNQDVNRLDFSVRKSIATTVAAIYVKTSIDDEEKLYQAEVAVNKLYRGDSLVSGRSMDIVSYGISRGLIDYYYDHKLQQHTWIINAPTDMPCIMANGETVNVGEPFSNGYIYGGTVHRNCQCTTIPNKLNDRYIKYLLGAYFLL